MWLVPGELVLLPMRVGEQCVRTCALLSAAVGTAHLFLRPSRAVKDVGSAVRISLWDRSTLSSGIIRAHCASDIDYAAGALSRAGITAAVAAPALGPRAAPGPPDAPAAGGLLPLGGTAAAGEVAPLLEIPGIR